MKPLFHYPPSSSIVLCFSVALFVISIDNISTCMCQDDSQYTTCKNGFACGSSAVSNMLNYPFWGENREQYCGDDAPELELKCEDGVPKITINLIKYRILDWSNTTQQLTVARDDYWDGVCAVRDDYKNSSFNNTPFQRDGTDFVNVTLLYNCASTTPNAPNLNHSDCDDGRVVYYVVDPSYSALCNPSISVSIPILGTQVSSVASGNKIDEALKAGFELRWSGDYAECQRCVESGGVCGNDGGSGFRCFCRDGPYTPTCNSQRAPTSSSSMFQSTLFLLAPTIFVSLHNK